MHVSTCCYSWWLLWHRYSILFPTMNDDLSRWFQQRCSSVVQPCQRCSTMSTLFNHVQADQLDHVQACEQHCSRWPAQPCSSWPAQLCSSLSTTMFKLSSSTICSSWPVQQPCSSLSTTKNKLCVFTCVGYCSLEKDCVTNDGRSSSDERYRGR